MRILITGGAGYLGSVITKHMLNDGHQVTIIDNLLFNQISPLEFTSNKNYNFIYGDVRNEKLLTDEVKKHDVIIPLAGIVGFPACANNPDLAWEINYKQIFNIVKTINNKQYIIFPNTNSGYGIGNKEIECTEESELSPISIYGETKVAAENFLRENTSAICFRLATVFCASLRMRTDLLVNEFVYKAMTDKYIVVFEKNFRRNFIYIQDVGRAFVHALKKYETMKNNSYNVGMSDTNLSKEELLNIIKNHIPDIAINYSDFYEDPDKRDYIVSNKKIESTGWNPQYTLDDGIIELMKTYHIIIPKMSFEFRNGFPLGYGNLT
jgi:nucleoside-diphosphate-sugar epimerase